MKLRFTKYVQSQLNVHLKLGHPKTLLSRTGNCEEKKKMDTINRIKNEDDDYGSNGFFRGSLSVF